MHSPMAPGLRRDPKPETGPVLVEEEKHCKPKRYVESLLLREAIWWRRTHLGPPIPLYERS